MLQRGCGRSEEEVMEIEVPFEIINFHTMYATNCDFMTHIFVYVNVISDFEIFLFVTPKQLQMFICTRISPNRNVFIHRHFINSGCCVLGGIGRKSSTMGSYPTAKLLIWIYTVNKWTNIESLKYMPLIQSVRLNSIICMEIFLYGIHPDPWLRLLFSRLDHYCI